MQISNQKVMMQNSIYDKENINRYELVGRKPIFKNMFKDQDASLFESLNTPNKQDIILILKVYSSLVKPLIVWMHSFLKLANT